MKRVIGAAIWLIAVIACSHTLYGQNTFDLSVEGPFLICENTPPGGPASLIVWIPQVGKTHFLPGFSSSRSELSLGDPSGSYWKYDPNLTAYEIRTATANSAFTFDEQSSSEQILLYREQQQRSFDCTGASTSNGIVRSKASVSIKVPFPNKIFTSERDGEHSCVLGQPSSHNNCGGAPPSRYATGVVLHYEHVAAGFPQLWSNAARPAQIAFDFSTPQTSIMEMKLDTISKPTRADGGLQSHQHASDSFGQVSGMSRSTRRLEFAPSGHAIKRTSATSGRSDCECLDNTLIHNDCKAPLVLLCLGASCQMSSTTHAR